MRSIKFRAWHFAEKKMLEVDELNHIASWSFEGMLGVNGINRTIGIQGGKHNDCVVMQSTGLFDKNGKEIYEGDIIESTRPAKEKYLVFWDKEDAAFYGRHELFESRFRMSDILNCVVVGNIYENPELINR